MGPEGGRGSNSVLSQANPGPSRDPWTEMGNTLGLAPMGALPRRSPRREEPLPNPGSFDELHRLCKGESLAFGGLTLKGQRRGGSGIWGVQ